MGWPFLDCEGVIRARGSGVPAKIPLSSRRAIHLMCEAPCLHFPRKPAKQMSSSSSRAVPVFSKQTGFDAQRLDLEAPLSLASRRRRLMARQGIDFSSNRYLGLAGRPSWRRGQGRARARSSDGLRRLNACCAAIKKNMSFLEKQVGGLSGSESALLYFSPRAMPPIVLSSRPCRSATIHPP